MLSRPHTHQVPEPRKDWGSSGCLLSASVYVTHLAGGSPATCLPWPSGSSGFLRLSRPTWLSRSHTPYTPAISPSVPECDHQVKLVGGSSGVLEERSPSEHCFQANVMAKPPRRRA